MRQFIRHPADTPIEVTGVRQPSGSSRHLYNVSSGGLAFQSDVEFEPGSVVDIRIPVVQPVFRTKARVVWCSARAGGFDLGVEFLSADDAFRARMVQQVCHIETYRKTVYETEGRALSAEEAAMEWIAKHASQFPDVGFGSKH